METSQPKRASKVSKAEQFEQQKLTKKNNNIGL